MKQTLACAACVAALSATAMMQDATIVTNPPEHFSTRVLVSGLEGPWEVAWGPDQQLWVTERTGRRVVRINPADGTRSVAVTIPEVNQNVSQDGLLGLAFHADLLRGTGNDFVYVVFTYDDAPGDGVGQADGDPALPVRPGRACARRAARHPDGPADTRRSRRRPPGVRPGSPSCI